MISTEAENFIADPSIEAVLVSTRHNTHASIAQAALSAGKHIYLEKPLALHMEELEKLAIVKALDDCAGNRTHAAGRLKISVRTLQRKLQQYELERQPKPSESPESDALTQA